jgi:hexosaminidase
LTDFARRLAPQIERHAALGIDGASSAFAPTAADRFDAVTGRVSVGLSNQIGLPIRYTLDGTPPGVKSPLYAGPLDLPLPTRVRAVTYDGARRMPGLFDRSYDAASVRRRNDRELRLCANKVPLALEDDAPATGTRASFLIDILEPCWIYPDAPLDGVTSIAIDVSQLPFNFQVGKDRDGVRFRPPATAAGEFEVRHGGCAGERIAVLPMAPAVGNAGVTRLAAPMTSRTGRADLCITYTARGVDPLWALGAVQLVTP